MDYGIVIEKIHQELKAYWGKGKVADYIPALAGVEPKRYGIAIETLDGHSFQVGDADIRFSIQSISKVFALAMVTRHLGDRIWKFVGREPSGNPFNSLVQLEYEHGIPRNPFINAGALVVTDRLMSLYEQPKDAILQFVRSICGNDDIYYDKHIARSEREHADRNMALGYLMKSFGNMEKMVAFVKCKGTCDKANVQYNYYGMDDCVKIAAAVPGAGDKACSYGCLGSGSCVKACQFDAIHIVDGVAVVDKEKCVACGACAAVCPRHLIDLVPYKAEHLVQCNSHDKGADVKKKCDAGCIGCTLCTKQCEADAIHMDNNVAVIDYEKCTNCGKCAEKCPAKVIL